MRLSERYAVPVAAALLYEFINTRDQRRYIEHGAPHRAVDAIAEPATLLAWLRAQGLDAAEMPTPTMHHQTLALRDALRDFIATAPPMRRPDAALDRAAMHFPLIVSIGMGGAPQLMPAPGSGALGRVLAEFQTLQVTNQLARLKMCDSEECRWVFFDRSKPANRRWCSSALCGNRQKTRLYRSRLRAAL